MRRWLGVSGWIVAAVALALVSSTLGAAQVTVDQSLQGRIIFRNDGAVFVYKDGYRYGVSAVRLSDDAITALPDGGVVERLDQLFGNVALPPPTAAQPAATPTLTLAVVAPVATPTVGGTAGTREAPVPYGQPYTFNANSRTYRVQVTRVERNALSLVKAANSFNDNPPSGQNYIMVQIRLTYDSGPSSPPFTTTTGEHRFYAGNRLWGAPSSVVMPEPQFRGQDVFPGGAVEGWLPPKFIPVELMDSAALVYDNVYFALR